MEVVLGGQELKLFQSGQELNAELDRQSGKELMLELVKVMWKTSRKD